MFEFSSQFETHGADIKIVGIGSSGINAINRMIEQKLQGVEFIGINTDMQSLARSRAGINIPIGEKITFGLGTGGNMEKGIQAIEQDKEEVIKALEGADLIFITTGLGGGTGTGCAYKIAEYAQEIGALSVGVVTKPFKFEGLKRMRVARQGLELLKKIADTVITIPNDRLLQVTSSNVSMLEAFKLADNILVQGVQSIIELVNVPALINLDFADLKTVIVKSGNAMIGIGEAEGDESVISAAKQAIESPLLELPFNGAKRVLLNICGGPELSLFEVNKAANLVTQAADPDAQIIFGAVVDKNFQNRSRVVIIATGFGEEKQEKEKFERKEKLNKFSFKESKEDDLDIPAFLRRRG